MSLEILKMINNTPNDYIKNIEANYSESDQNSCGKFEMQRNVH